MIDDAMHMFDSVSPQIRLANRYELHQRGSCHVAVKVRAHNSI